MPHLRDTLSHLWHACQQILHQIQIIVSHLSGTAQTGCQLGDQACLSDCHLGRSAHIISLCYSAFAGDTIIRIPSRRAGSHAHPEKLVVKKLGGSRALADVLHQALGHEVPHGLTECTLGHHVLCQPDGDQQFHGDPHQSHCMPDCVCLPDLVVTGTRQAASNAAQVLHQLPRHLRQQGGIVQQTLEKCLLPRSASRVGGGF